MHLLIAEPCPNGGDVCLIGELNNIIALGTNGS